MSHREPAAPQIQLAHDGDVAVGGGAELPVHEVVVDEVLPAVAGADEAAADAGESATGAHGERAVVFPGEQHLVAGDVDGAGGVAGAAAVEVRGEQGVNLRRGSNSSWPSMLDVLQDHGVVWVADEFFGQGVAAVGIAIDVADAERLGMDVVEGS